MLWLVLALSGMGTWSYFCAQSEQLPGLPIYLSVYLFVSVADYLTACLSVCLSVCVRFLYVSLSVYPLLSRRGLAWVARK